MDKQCHSNRDLERSFFERVPKIFNDCSENEAKMDNDTTMETKPTIGREEKLRKVERKLLSNKTNERFTNYEGVINDPNSDTKDNLSPKSTWQ